MTETLKKEFQSTLLELARHHSNLNTREQIHDNLSILSYYLPQLKVNLIRKDDEKLQRILTKFLKQDTSLNHTVSLIGNFHKELTAMENHYIILENLITENFPLEHSISIDSSHKKYLNRLFDCHKTQKELIFHIGKEFVNLSRKISAESNEKIYI